MMERKSLVLQFPNFLAPAMGSHFMRGCFDGDGYIGPSGKNVLLSYATGSESFVESIAEVMESVTGYRPKLWKHKRWNSYQIGVYNKKAAQFGEWLYEGSEDKNRMQRKHERYLDLCLNKESDT